MKLNTRDFKIPNFATTNVMDPIPAELIERNRKQLLSFICQVKPKLESIKNEMYTLLDAGFQNTQILKIDGFEDPMFKDLVSTFLEKAYAVQVYGYTLRQQEVADQNCDNLTKEEVHIIKSGKDKYELAIYTINQWTLTVIDKSKIDFEWKGSNASMLISPSNKLYDELRQLQPNVTGQSLENRNQTYIDFGTQFNEQTNLTGQKKLLHSSGEIIRALNGMLSTLNRIEFYICNEEYDIAAGHLSGLEVWIDTLFEYSRATKLVTIVDEGGIQSTLSWILDLLTKLLDYCRNFFTPQHEINKERFFKFEALSQQGSSNLEQTPEDSSAPSF